MQRHLAMSFVTALMLTLVVLCCDSKAVDQDKVLRAILYSTVGTAVLLVYYRLTYGPEVSEQKLPMAVPNSKVSVSWYAFIKKAECMEGYEVSSRGEK